MKFKFKKFSIFKRQLSQKMLIFCLPKLFLTKAKRTISFFTFSLFFLLSGCQSIYFFPEKEIVWAPDSMGYDYNIHKLQITSDDYVTIWEVIPPKKAKGSILFLHGNAENVSTHIQSVMWLVAEGYRIFALDYRGYGQSSGNANIENAIEDIKESLVYINKLVSKEEKLLIFGQSIGASLGIVASASSPLSPRVSGFIFDSGFSGFQDIIKEKLEQGFMFSPLASLFSFFAPNAFDPVNSIKMLPAEKLVIVHAKDDQVVSFKNAEILWGQTEFKAHFWQSETGGHTSYFTKQANRLKLLSFFESR